MQVLKESALEKRCCNWARETHYALSIKLAKRGWPDRVFLIPHCPVLFVEFKALGKKPSLLQKYWLNRLHIVGFSVVYLDNFEDFRDVFCAHIKAPLEPRAVSV